MNRSLTSPRALAAWAFSLTALAVACGTSSLPSFGNPNGGDGGSGGSGGASSSGGFGTSSGGLGNNVLDDSGSGGGGSSGGGIACPSGLSCNVSCSGGGTTSITGTVYDPAGKNPLYDVAVYVPATALTPLPKGVPTGAEACSCGALYASGAIANTTTAVDGTFTLKNVPVGAKVPLVIQIGKFRRLYSVAVTACTANAQPDKSLAFLGTIPAGDTDDNIPDIAVSTGFADTLECLMLRVGFSAAEYVPGSSTAGHVHVFSGGQVAAANPPAAELNAMAGAPASSTALWDSQADLMPYDIVLLSCEGDETYNAQPANLEAYLNAGGRAFASHFHHAWFSGPIDGAGGSYTAPADWGTHLATWSDSTGAEQVNGAIDTVLNGSTAPFSKGVALAAWLQLTNALTGGQLPIYQARYNAVVGPTNTASQPWITSGASTMYFSFDTPVNAPVGDSGVPNYCGRAVFSDLHVSGNPSISDTENVPVIGKPPPAGCDDTELSPQEKALEFMLFDLSSCVIPDTVAVPLDGGLPPPPTPK